jgi:hypothetical protein
VYFQANINQKGKRNNQLDKLINKFDDSYGVVKIFPPLQEGWRNKEEKNLRNLKQEKINSKGITYEARKSTPKDLGSLKYSRECKSVANTVYIHKQCHISVRNKTKSKIARTNNHISVKQKKLP